jgi:CDP-glycerol glycerophosphotransferase (TagB/SpsB family)
VVRPASASSLTLPEAVPLAHALLDRVAQAAGVRVLFIKGPAAAEQGLRSPRTSADVDTLVDPAGLERLRARLTELGWVDDHPYSTPTAAGYSRTHRHPAWPCELDLHVTFPGLYADPQAVFEHLWSRRAAVDVAGQEIACPDVQAHTLLLALNSLRDPHSIAKSGALEDLAERVAATFDAVALTEIGQLASNLGASDTSAPFLSMVNAPNQGLGSTSAADMEAWRLRTQPAWRVATWMRGLREQPIGSVPRYLWRAVVLSEAELRSAHPELPPGRRALARARWRRLKRGATRAPAALKSIRSSHAAVSPAEVQPATHGVLRVTIGLLDYLLPVKSGVVVRTFPDFDDQGLAMCAELAGRSGRITWLSAFDDASRFRAIAPELADRVRVLPARSVRGIGAYLLARTVIHTHGLYHEPPRSRHKVFVNLWHGMPIKRLNPDPAVAARQTDVLTVTSDVHARHLAETWHLAEERIHSTGLPRNDRMLRAAAGPRPARLAHRVGERPLVVWLPTYRNSVVGELRDDGKELGNPFQLPGATAATVSAVAARLGIHLVVKLHPMAPRRSLGEQPHLSVWDEAALDEHGATLYELLGHADALVTDHSSVWVDYLMLDRPMVFSIADMDSYAASRGHYFVPLEEHLPGPVAPDLDSVESALAELLHVTEPARHWAEVRSRLLPLHHAWLDDRSARRVADLCR